MGLNKLNAFRLGNKFAALAMASAFIALAGCHRHTVDERTPTKNATVATAEADDGGAALLLVGQKAPAFKLENVAGGTVNSSDLAGKVYVLDFWATWCPPCRASLPHLASFAEEEKSAGVMVYAVNDREDKKTVAAFVDKTKLTVPVLLDIDGQSIDAFKGDTIPETVVVGKDGVIAKVILGFVPATTPGELKAAVEAALKK